MIPEIYTKLVGKTWTDKHGNQLTFSLLGENLVCNSSASIVGRMFETNATIVEGLGDEATLKMLQEKLGDTMQGETIQTIVNFAGDTELFLTVITSFQSNEKSTYVYFLNFRPDNSLAFVSAGPVAPLIENKNQETIDTILPHTEIYTVK